MIAGLSALVYADNGGKGFPHWTVHSRRLHERSTLLACTLSEISGGRMQQRKAPFRVESALLQS